MGKCIVALAAAAAGAVGQAGAVEPVDRFQMLLGAYAIQNDLDLRWDSSAAEGTRVDFHRDLGFDDSRTRPYWGLNGLLGEHHQLSAFGYKFASEGEKVLERDYVIDGTVYPTDAAFAGDLQVKMNGLAYTWLFHRAADSAAGVGLGAVRYEVSADLAAAVLDGESGDVETVEKRVSEAAWAPMLRASYARALARQWRVAGEVAYVKKSGGNASGDAIDANVRLECFPWQHFGFALRYNYNDVDLGFRRSGFRGDINLKNRGPQLLASYRF